MSNFLWISFLTISIICGAAFILYIPRMVYFFHGFKKQKKVVNDKKNRLCVLVAAKNEAAGVKYTLDDLRRQTYDKNMFDVWVVVSRSDDATIGTLDGYPEVKLHIAEGTKSKGEALNDICKKFLREGSNYDAYVVIDADNLVDPNCLLEANNALALNKDIIVFRKRTKNFESKNSDTRSVVSNIGALIWYFVDDMGNKYRTKRNIPICITGTGMMVRANVIKTLGGYTHRTITEDAELLCECIMKDFTGAFYEHAIVYTEEAVSHKQQTRRRVRWVKGFIKCQKLYKREIKHKTFGGENITFKYFDFLYGILPIVIFAVASVLGGIMMLGCSAVLAIMGYYLWKTALWYGLICLGSTYLGLVIYTVMGLIIAGKDFKISFLEKIAVVLISPLYHIEYVSIYFRAVFTKTYEWDNIERITFAAEDEGEGINAKV